MLPVTIGTAIGLIAAAMGVSDEGPVVPEGNEGELGLTDSELWDAIWARDFSLVINEQVPFNVAVIRDPRRIDAMIQGHLIDPVSKPLFALQQGGPIQPSLLRSLFLMRLDAIRETQGLISAKSLAEAAAQEWGDYQRVLDRLLIRMVQAGDPVAQAVGKALVINADAIRVGFDNVRSVISDAEAHAARDEDRGAWRAMLVTFENAQGQLLGAIEQLPKHLPDDFGSIPSLSDLEAFEDQFGGVSGPAITLADIQRARSLPRQGLDLSSPRAAAVSTGLAYLPPGPMPYHTRGLVRAPFPAAAESGGQRRVGPDGPWKDFLSSGHRAGDLADPRQYLEMGGRWVWPSRVGV